MSTQAKITQAYIEYVLEHNARPNVYIFCKNSKLKEADFYDTYGTIEAVEAAIWTQTFADSRTRVEKEEVYAGYSVREKLLAFYYTFIEELKSQRSFFLWSYQQLPPDSRLSPAIFKEMRQHFIRYAQELIQEGVESNEIAQRIFITDQYPSILWGQLRLILDFWFKDMSAAFEKTDVFIEKNVNLAFDLMNRSFVDSSVDYLRYMLQNR
ncbi:TetR family transcriptional regulator C-terminal domain-containing protein [Eisenibacter elegans]|uniref:TetR family transcriptional regulator C-terminal domain-containing protein n=1 Tax=Eisenibacter elegans TaxID=997 RepID=UPI00041C83DA|nr:TetR family transcriptional regulator C-terminal domain-containing protein [Eisenibacter elegans]